MADRAAWKNFKKQMTAKRGNKKNTSGVKILEEESMTVQRLSADVSGKAQKYTRVGAREFVPFEYEEVTVENIKLACLNHFDISETAVCDVLAGEQGPSCSSVKQIPNLSVIHVRFIDGEDVANKPAIKENPVPIKKRKTAVESVQLFPAGATATTSVSSTAVKTKFIPRSMSAVEMLRLGKEIKSTHDITEIRIYGFDLGNMSWAPTPNKVDFVIAKDPIGTGGFRQAFKATSQTKGFDKAPWVVKKNLKQTVDDIEYLGQTVEQHTKKTVQMHNLARDFTVRLQQEVVKKGKAGEFGEVLQYNKVFFGKCGDECVTVEDFIPGTFDKHVNNTGHVCGNTETDLCQKAECFAHYSFERSDKQLIVLDIQGCDYMLCDPEVATKETSSDGEFLFCTGNLSSTAIEQFTSSHVCNKFCKILDLPMLKE
ncbi:transient receptor potential cation channel subfamily M member 6-like [Dendronephthya gigantea]|uniref:transient receptor potential cation channel subfamily M member 6-like n=1 Tax=Dendronephthya gigantea TaxID=151771 RepID=UPI00106DC9E3|nr:transient receptor potential cation channel subfamily M member 6-like [Dendronephthya gigantea]